MLHFSIKGPHPPHGYFLRLHNSKTAWALYVKQNKGEGGKKKSKCCSQRFQGNKSQVSMTPCARRDKNQLWSRRVYARHTTRGDSQTRRN